MRHLERHKTERIGWLRAAVLGANDGIVSTASLVLGVAAAGASSKSILVAGIAGLVAGAMSMAAGEYVSVSSQADTERADLARERQELATAPQSEHKELTAIYVTRGLDSELASEVATQLMAHDALGAHTRDELGMSDALTARPVQAALASAGTFAVGVRPITDWPKWAPSLTPNNGGASPLGWACIHLGWFTPFKRTCTALSWLLRPWWTCFAGCTGRTTPGC
jgi:VIT1/CCC1 family predicted Fe2+/Mn2+ transporter